MGSHWCSNPAVDTVFDSSDPAEDVDSTSDPAEDVDSTSGQAERCYTVEEIDYYFANS